MNHRNKCSTCKGKKGKLTNQYCLENPKNPNYQDNEDWIYDCWGFIRSNETKEEYQIRINQKWDDKNQVELIYVNE